MTLRNSGLTWVALSASPETGDLQVRLSESDHVVTGVVLSGSVTGAAKDVSDAVHVATGVSVEIRGEAEMQGTAAVAVPYALGRLRGSITFRDESGATGRCTAALWLLQPQNTEAQLVGQFLGASVWLPFSSSWEQH